MKIKRIIDMLYLAYIQFNFSNLALKSSRQLMFFTIFYTVVEINREKDFNETYSNLFPGFNKLVLNIERKILWYVN